MDPRLIALHLILHAAGSEPNVETYRDRKRVHKLIYLSQRLGVDLGFRFAWELNGPYSKELSIEHYNLINAIQQQPKEFSGISLIPEAKKKLEDLKTLNVVPEKLRNKVTLDEWLEILASVNYLTKVANKSTKKVREIFRGHKTKKEYLPYIDCAIKTLKKVGLQ